MEHHYSGQAAGAWDGFSRRGSGGEQALFLHLRAGDARDGILTAPTLSATLSGSGKITATAQIAGLTDALMSGSGNIVLSGSTQNLNAKVTGSGNIKAISYPCQNADIMLSGSGNIEVAPSDTLKGTLSGSGDVRYVGEPIKNVTITGSGNLVKVQ